MTAATRSFDEAARAPTVVVCAGRVLVLAGLVFGTANLVQYGVRSGALGWHEATLGLNWLVALGVFFPVLFRLRRIGGEAARRAAGWSRAAILTMVAAALVLAAASAVIGDWTLMYWTSVATLALYGLVWLVAFGRARRPGLALIAATAFAGAAWVATRMGTPEQYLLQAVTLGLVAVLPGLWLAFGRRL